MLVSHWNLNAQPDQGFHTFLQSTRVVNEHIGGRHVQGLMLTPLLPLPWRSVQARTAWAALLTWPAKGPHSALLQVPAVSC